MRTRKSILTAAELAKLPTAGRRLELVRGELYEMPPAGGAHGSVAMRLGILLGRYVLDNHLGEVFAAETGFILSRRPDTVRAPDVSFVARDRLPEGELPADYMEVVPDLAVEVVSPNDRAREVREKTEDWLGAGVPLVWVINPATRSVTVHETLEDFEELSETGILDGGQVLPGFICEINKLFS